MEDLTPQPKQPETWPERLQRRPVDSRRGVPIPVVSVRPGDGPVEDRADFTAILGDEALRVAQEKQCGLCGEPLDYWIAFLGGPRSAEQRTYTDPPMHSECARAALSLCPHLAVTQHRRAPEHRLAGDVATPPYFVEDKPSTWVLGITRSFTIRIFDNGTLVFFAAPWKQTETYGYGEDGVLRRLVEAPSNG